MLGLSTIFILGMFLASTGAEKANACSRHANAHGSTAPTRSARAKTQTTGSAMSALSTVISPSDLQHAQDLYRQSLVVLAHDHRQSTQDLKAAQAAGITALTAQLSVDGIYWNIANQVRITPSFPLDPLSHLPGYEFYVFFQNFFQQALTSIFSITENAAENPPIRLVTSVDDIYAAKAEGKLAVILGSEGAAQVTRDPQNPDPSSTDTSQVDVYYAKGWRETQLRWLANDLLDGANLSPFGAAVVKRCNQLGIVIDTNHLFPSELQEVIAASSEPVLRSHDSPQSFGGQSSDADIQAVARSGGGHGVFAMQFYDGYYPAGATINTMVQAITYVVRLVGIDHVALGSDYFPENGNGWLISDVSRTGDLVLALIQNGYSDGDIQKILGLNLLALYQRVWSPTPPRALCRAAQGPCDVAEYLNPDGNCPADSVMGNGVACTNALGIQTSCSGYAKACPNAIVGNLNVTAGGSSILWNGDYQIQAPSGSSQPLSTQTGSLQLAP